MALPSQTEVRPVLLSVLAELGSARPRDVYPLVTARFRGIAPEDLTATRRDGRNLWHNRIQWVRYDLAREGLIDTSEPSVWALTPVGAEAARGLPTAAPPAAGAEDAPAGDEAAEDEAALPDEGDALRPPAALSILPGEAQRIAAELAAASVDSRDPARFERAVGEALAFLGFETDVIGGAGKTDVLAVAPLGVNRYQVVLDAKSAAGGRVADGQIDWLSMRAHREHERADHACVVGPGFAGGQLKKRADEFDTSLLTAGELAGLVAAHADTPLALTDLRPVFASAPLAGTAIPQALAAARDRARRLRLVVRLLGHVDTLNKAQPGLVLAKADTLFASVIAQPDDGLQGVTLDDVRSALALIETVGALRPANGDGYVSQTSLGGALRMLSALGDAARGRADAEAASGGEARAGGAP